VGAPSLSTIIQGTTASIVGIYPALGRPRRDAPTDLRHESENLSLPAGVMYSRDLNSRQFFFPQIRTTSGLLKHPLNPELRIYRSGLKFNGAG